MEPTAVYSEFDPFAAAWLRALCTDGSITLGGVDERSIVDLAADDLRRHRRVHLFAGAGGWDHALNLAGWPADRPVWTGSCPCQPYSSAGKGLGEKDPRDLWPHMRRLVAECRPECVFGEQVPGAIGHGWLDRIQRDLEGEGYAVGAVVLGAHSVGAPHIRQRLYWVASLMADPSDVRHRGRPGRQGSGVDANPLLSLELEGCGPTGVVADPVSGGLRGGRHGADGGPPSGVPGADGERQRVWPDAGSGRGAADGLGDPAGQRCGEAGGADAQTGATGVPADTDAIGVVGNAGVSGPQGRGVPGGGRAGERPAGEAGGETGFAAWSEYDLIPCRDGKVRRTQPGLFPLAHGIPSRQSDPRLGYLVARLVELGYSAKVARRMVREARGNRVGRLRGYGNAIVPQVAAVFVRAFLESEG